MRTKRVGINAHLIRGKRSPSERGCRPTKHLLSLLEKKFPANRHKEEESLLDVRNTIRELE